jgi:hypothetical protein
MIRTQDLEEAFSTKKVMECGDKEMVTEVTIAISSFAARIGEAVMLEDFLEKTVELMCSDLKKYYRHMHIGEACLAMRTTDLTSDIKYGRKACAETFRHAIDKFLLLPERLAYKESLSAKWLPAPVVMPENEQDKWMRAAWKLVCEAERKRQLYNDPGNALFDYMKSKGKIDMDEADIEDSLEYHRAYAEESNNPFAGIQSELSKEALRKHKHGDSSFIMPMAKKFALRRVRREQIMEIEASKIKANGAK